VKVFLSPHLDDVVLSCYGALDVDSLVVTVFAAVPPPGAVAVGFEVALRFIA
jgi:hypothetical protein